ncbi:MAG: DegT/DnrJ/EryC1/StrS family aminotransferase [Candidatus Eremiobacteraeota bacterium]|nr:DegT/DnrJ/EryC1/StrS family aminotransferase [Candidatus Eremiobacteraeota bacterium]MBV8366677.1 DegT/DnrJ/EryC1/StrS family aminotransferase [Candidatus Eremiobacteraeota bacterium]
MSSKIPFVDLRQQHAALRPALDAAIGRVLERADFILGADVEEFEAEFAAFCGARYCIGASSGTSALRMALLAAGVGPGDEVVIPANTYIATAIAVTQCGATPVLVDVDASYLIDVGAVAAALTARTKAIVPVHLYGRIAPMQALLALARARGIDVIEDACQAHGASMNGKRAGTFGRASAFSFYPGKNLGACGDGGAVVTDDEALADEVRLLRDFGQRRKYEHSIKGGNERLDTLQAAVLRVKLPLLERWNERRIEAAARYEEALASAGIRPAQRAADGSDVYHLYVIETEGRDELRAQLSAAGIESGIHYPIPIHRQRAYADLGLGEGVFPATETAAARLLSLPMFPEIQASQIQRVVEVLARARDAVALSA